MSSKIVTDKIKKYLNYFGTLLALTGVVFVILRLHKYWQGIDFKSISMLAWAGVALLSFCYAAANLFLAQAWRFILNSFGIRVTVRWAIYAYGTSQLAKYVPGNIFHIAGRQAIAMAAGMPGKDVLKANIIELVMISGLGTLALWIVSPLLCPIFSLTFASLLLLLSIALTLYLANKFFNQHIAKAIVCHLLFLLSAAAIFALILDVLRPDALMDIPLMIKVGGVYTLAWLAGLIMPGAPAGIGIRELVVVYFLTHFIPDGELLLAVLIGRITTVCGDILFFVSACMADKRIN